MYQLEEIENVTSKMISLFDYPVALLTEESGLSRPTVSKFFNNKWIKPSSAELLYDLCLQKIKEKGEKRKSNLEKEKKFTKTFKLDSLLL